MHNYYAQDTHQRVPTVNSNAQLINRIGIIMDSRFHGNDTNVIIVISAKAGIHPMQESFPHKISKSQKKVTWGI